RESWAAYIPTELSTNGWGGDIVPEHAVPVEVFFYVVEGTGTLCIGKDERVVVAKDIITCPANTTMALRADQGEPFIVLNVKTPSL
ncbi:MAG: cupin domain-containing protein, partial [Firmicutes bacterium]|nr:cupin domain-containing protein [Bacillota bacterium]